MVKFLNFFKQNLIKLVPIAILFALAAGYIFNTSFLKVSVSYILFLMIYPMMINLNIFDVFKTFKAPKKIIIASVINFVVSPVLAITLSKIFFANQPELAIGLILLSLLPTSGMTASWTGLAGGNLKLSLAIMSSNLLLSIGILPLYLSIIDTGDVVIKTGLVFASLIKIVVIPLILGDITRRFLIKVKGEGGYKKLKPSFGGISSLGVILIIFVAVSLKSTMIIKNIDLALYSAIPLLIYYLVLITVSNEVGKRFMGTKDHIALVFSTTMRNLTIALGMAMGLAGGNLTVFLLALAYMIQLPLASMYYNYTQKKLMKNIEETAA